MIKNLFSSSPTGTSFDSGAISNGFSTIDSGLYDNALLTGQVDAGARSGQYDVTMKSGQYQTTLQSGQFGGSLASGQFDSGVKTAQYDTSLRSGQYDTGARSGHYDLSYKSAQYGSGVRAGQYDTLDGVLPAFTWSTTTLPSASTTVVAGNTSTYTYQASSNNAAGGSSPVSLTLPSSLSGERKQPSDKGACSVSGQHALPVPAGVSFGCSAFQNLHLKLNPSCVQFMGSRTIWLLPLAACSPPVELT